MSLLRRSVSFSKGRLRWEIGLRLVVILVIAALLQSRSLRQFIAETQPTLRAYKYINHRTAWRSYVARELYAPVDWGQMASTR